jgi:hypothetical protein
MIWVVLALLGGVGVGWTWARLDAARARRRRAARPLRICGHPYPPDGFCPLPTGHGGAHRIVVIPPPMGPITDADEALMRKVRGWQEGPARGWQEGRP